MQKQIIRLLQLLQRRTSVLETIATDAEGNGARAIALASTTLRNGPSSADFDREMNAAREYTFDRPPASVPPSVAYLDALPSRPRPDCGRPTCQARRAIRRGPFRNAVGVIVEGRPHYVHREQLPDVERALGRLTRIRVCPGCRGNGGREEMFVQGLGTLPVHCSTCNGNGWIPVSVEEEREMARMREEEGLPPEGWESMVKSALRRAGQAKGVPYHQHRRESADILEGRTYGLLARELGIIAAECPGDDPDDWGRYLLSKVAPWREERPGASVERIASEAMAVVNSEELAVDLAQRMADLFGRPYGIVGGTAAGRTFTPRPRRPVPATDAPSAADEKEAEQVVAWIGQSIADALGGVCVISGGAASGQRFHAREQAAPSKGGVVIMDDEACLLNGRPALYDHVSKMVKYTESTVYQSNGRPERVIGYGFHRPGPEDKIVGADGRTIYKGHLRDK